MSIGIALFVALALDPVVLRIQGKGASRAPAIAIVFTVLSHYFLASLDTMKASLYQLAPAHGRPKLAELTEQITRSVGSAIAGGARLSLMNAAFSFVLLWLLGSSSSTSRTCRSRHT